MDISRYSNLGSPDILFIYGGTNDFRRPSPSIIGNYLETIDSSQFDLFNFKQAFQFLIQNIQTLYPNTKIFIIGISYFTRDFNLFAKNSQNINQIDIHNIIKEIAFMYGIGYIDISDCGINYFNASNYLLDGLHPNRAGMQLIYEKVLGTLREYFI